MTTDREARLKRIEERRLARESATAKMRKIDVNVKFYIDGFNFWLMANNELKKDAEIMNQFFEYAKLSPCDLTITAERLADKAVSMIYKAADFIEDLFATLYTEAGVKATTSGKVYVNELLGKKLEHESCEAFIVTNQATDIFVGAPINRDRIRWILNKELQDTRRRGDSNSEAMLIENIALLDDGKLKNRSCVIDLNSYEEFFDLIIEKINNSDIKFGVTKHRVTGYDGVRLNEKGVDALLIMSVLDDIHNGGSNCFCFFTNDSDYFPVVERIKKANGIPFLFYSNTNQRIARELISAFGNDFCVPIELSQPNFSFDFPSSWFTDWQFFENEVLRREENEAAWREFSDYQEREYLKSMGIMPKDD